MGENSLNEKKTPSKFIINVAIGVILLIILVLCTLWIGIDIIKAAFNLGTGDTLQDIDEQVNISKEYETDRETGGNLDKFNEEKPSKQQDDDEISETDDKKTENEVKSDSEGNGENTDSDHQITPKPETEKKPLVTPAELPETEVFAVYNNSLFIGDSRTEGFRLYSGVKNASYFCMKSMTIDKIADGKQLNINGGTFSVYDMLEQGQYEKIIIGVGLNELGWNHIDTFLSYYGKLIDNIKESQPQAEIYLQAVLPVTKSKNDSDRVHNNAQIYWYNENIIKLAEEKNVKFVNPAAALVDEDGFLVDSSTTDGIHLKSEYCKIWAKYLAELIG